MAQKALEIFLSETHASGNREVQTKDLSTQAMLIPDAKATAEKEWKEVMKKAHKNKKVREVHFAALMDIRHIQKYVYLPGNVRKSNLKCENYPAQMKELYTNFQRRSMKQEWGQRIEIGTIIDEMVDGCHRWKVARMNSLSSSSAFTIIE